MFCFVLRVVVFIQHSILSKLVISDLQTFIVPVCVLCKVFFYCSLIYVVGILVIREGGWDHINCFIPPPLYACAKSGLRFPMPYDVVFITFNGLMLRVVVHLFMFYS